MTDTLRSAMSAVTSAEDKEFERALSSTAKENIMSQREVERMHQKTARPIAEQVNAATRAVQTTVTPTNLQAKVIGLKTGDNSVGVNPKDKIGASKVDFTLIPTSAKIAMALALMDGAQKYGAYNWRVEPVQLLTYIGAAERHLEAFKESEAVATDSLIEHLGHVMACCGIMIDALKQGTFTDNRPVNGQGGNLITEANNWIAENKPAGWGR